MIGSQNLALAMAAALFLAVAVYAIARSRSRKSGQRAEASSEPPLSREASPPDPIPAPSLPREETAPTPVEQTATSQAAIAKPPPIKPETRESIDDAPSRIDSEVWVEPAVSKPDRESTLDHGRLEDYGPQPAPGQPVPEALSGTPAAGVAPTPEAQALPSDESARDAAVERGAAVPTFPPISHASPPSLAANAMPTAVEPPREIETPAPTSRRPRRSFTNVSARGPSQPAPQPPETLHGFAVLLKKYTQNPQLGSAYLAWNDALFQHFFNEEAAGTPVFVSVDDSVVRHAGTHLGPQEGAAADFLASVRSVAPPDEIITAMLGLGRTWADGDASSPPPFFGGLAAAVYAASKMGSARELAGHNYYAFLNEALGRPRGAGQPPDFDAASGLWRLLNFWLATQKAGTLGLGTARQFGGYSFVGWPLSQALVRPADLAEIETLRSWLLSISEDTDAMRIAGIVNLWLREEGAGTRLNRLLGNDATLEDLIFASSTILSAIRSLPPVSSAAFESPPINAGWLHAYRSGYTWAACECAIAWPIDEQSEEESDDATKADWESFPFSPAQAGLGQHAITDASTRVSTKVALESPILLCNGEGRNRPGWWVQDLILPALGESFHIVASPADAEHIASALRGCAKADWKRHDGLAWLPPGWVLFADVMLEKPPTGPLTEFVRALEPAWRIVGGARLRRNAWVQGSIVRIEAATNQEFVLRNESRSTALTLKPGAPVDTSTLAPGTYSIGPAGGDSRTFVVSTPPWPPHPAATARATQIESKRFGTLRISGARVSADNELTDPVLLSSETSWLILGRAPGQAQLIRASKEVAFREPDVGFEAEWSVQLRKGVPVRIWPLKALPDPPLPDTSPHARRRDLRLWKHGLLAGGKGPSRIIAKAARSILERYREIARGERR